MDSVVTFMIVSASWFVLLQIAKLLRAPMTTTLINIAINNKIAYLLRILFAPIPVLALPAYADITERSLAKRAAH